MPIRFLLMGDRHNSENTPKSRIDNFQESVKAKDEEIMSIAKQYNVAAILQAGDFWTDGDARIKNDFIPEIVKRWIDPMNPGKSIPMIGIAGNHDLIGNNINSLPNTTLGLTVSLGYQKLASKDNPIIFTMDDGKTVAITGTNYHLHMDEPEYLSDYIVDKKAGDYHIHIVHGMLSPKNLGKMMKHTVIDDIKNTAADITFCGHDHLGFDTVFTNGKYFVNPGAVVRLKNDKKELTRKVKVVLVTIDDSGITLEDIYLKSMKDSSITLSRDVIERKKERDEAAKKIKTQIDKLSANKRTKFSEILLDTFKREEVPESIMKDLQKRISDKEIKTNALLTVPHDTQIVKMKLENFQSHENTEIDFDKGFNIIIGESRQGKTAILRALRWVLENRPQGKAIIRNGAERASVTLRLANGTFIERYMFKDDKKGNGYHIILPDGTEQEGNTKLVGLVQSICGFNHMDVDEKTKLPINFLRQGEGWYLIDENVSATERARIIGAIQNTQAADSVVKDLDKENSQINTCIKKNNTLTSKSWEEINGLTSEKEHLEKIKRLIELIILRDKINEYFLLKQEYSELCRQEEDITKAYSKILESNIISKIKELQRKQDVIRDESDRISEQSVKLKDANDSIKASDDILKMTGTVSRIKEFYNKYNELLDAYLVYKKEVKRQADISWMMKELEGCKDKIPDEIKALLTRKEEIEASIVLYKKQSNAKAIADNFIKSSEKVLNDDSIIQKIYNLLSVKDLVDNECAVIAEENKKIQVFETKIKDCDAQIKEYENKKISILKDAKICPVCAQIIPDDFGGHIHE